MRRAFIASEPAVKRRCYDDLRTCILPRRSEGRGQLTRRLVLQGLLVSGCVPPNGNAASGRVDVDAFDDWDVSPSGRWIAVAKPRADIRDSILLVDTHGLQPPRLLGREKGAELTLPTFLKEDALLVAYFYRDKNITRLPVLDLSSSLSALLPDIPGALGGLGATQQGLVYGYMIDDSSGRVRFFERQSSGGSLVLFPPEFASAGRCVRVRNGEYLTSAMYVAAPSTDVIRYRSELSHFGAHRAYRLLVSGNQLNVERIHEGNADLPLQFQDYTDNGFTLSSVRRERSFDIYCESSQLHRSRHLEESRAVTSARVCESGDVFISLISDLAQPFDSAKIIQRNGVNSRQVDVVDVARACEEAAGSAIGR